MACVTDELKENCPDPTIVHGKPRHPKSEGNIKLANGDSEDTLKAWLNDLKTTP